MKKSNWPINKLTVLYLTSNPGSAIKIVSYLLKSSIRLVKKSWMMSQMLAGEVVGRNAHTCAKQKKTT